MTLKGINKICGVACITLTVLVAIPLTVKTIMEGGGPWGFEIVGLAILVPLSGYFLFGIAGCFQDDEKQRRLFIVAHVVTIITGIMGYFTFPIYPIWVALIPL